MRRLDELAVKRSSLAKAIFLLCSLNNPAFERKQKEFVRSLPHKDHSQGPRRKVIHLPGGVDVALNVTYYHRKKDPTKAAQKPNRGVSPALMLLGISSGLTPHVRRRMAKASALLGSYEEASEMLADEGIAVSVNKLREVCGHIGRRLVQLTSAGSVQVEGTVANRCIVVSLDGGRVRLREARKGRTKKGRKKFATKGREPRLFIIYAVNENGRMAHEFAPIIDGTLISCDRLFEMLQAYLISIGSGAIESAVRRVINQRVKSNSTYWLRENPETMICLRA